MIFYRKWGQGARSPFLFSTGRNVEIDAEEGLRSKAVGEAVYESGKTGQVVKVNDVIKGRVNAYQKDIDRMWKL